MVDKRVEAYPVSKEKSFLLSAYGHIRFVELKLKTGEENAFGVFQGALREVYNTLMEIVYSQDSSTLDEKRKGKLEELSNDVFSTRNNVVDAVEVHGRDFREVSSEIKVLEKLGKYVDKLKKYLRDWYEVDVESDF